MKYLIAFIPILVFWSASSAQQVLNAAGTSRSNGGLQLEWSLGETGVQSTRTDFAWITEGVLQPEAGTTNQLPPALANLPSISGYGLDNAGTTFLNTTNGNSLMLEFTLGETASRTLGLNNTLLTQGILQPYPLINNGPLPVTGLQFYARRLNAQQVQLDWSTRQEVNNRGFQIERKREGDNGFSDLHFVPTAVAGGNSTAPLSYQYQDANPFAGKTWYRLRQEDIDNRTSYSAIRMVAGSKEKTVSLKAWPIPAKEFQVQMSGSSGDQLLIYTAVGQVVRRVPVRENEPVLITGLLPGTYLLRLAATPDLVQRVTVQ